MGFGPPTLLSVSLSVLLFFPPFLSAALSSHLPLFLVLLAVV